MRNALYLFFSAQYLIHSSFAQTIVRGYVKSNGTVVAPHRRTQSNGTNVDNWRTTGNTNPMNGSRGSTAPDYSLPAQNYGAGRPVQTGPNGGKFTINERGNKVYQPKQ